MESNNKNGHGGARKNSGGARPGAGKPPTLTSGVKAQIALRGDKRPLVINTSLERYFAVIEFARRELQKLFTTVECGLMCDALNGVLFADTISIQLVDAEIEAALGDLSPKWKADPTVLQDKLKTLRYCDKLALVDAVERWWNRSAAGEDVSPEELFSRK